MQALSILLRVIAIGSGVVAIALFFRIEGKLEESRQSLAAAESAKESAVAEAASTGAEINSLREQLGIERSALSEAKGQLENLRFEMHTARQEVARTQDQLDQAAKEIETLENTGRRLRENLIETEQNVTLPSNHPELVRLRSVIADLELANQDLREEIRSLKIQANAASSLQQTRHAENTTVIESIRPNEGLIVIQSRPEFNLSVGDTRFLNKDGSRIASIRIIRLGSDLAVASLLRGSRVSDLATGEVVNITP